MLTTAESCLCYRAGRKVHGTDKGTRSFEPCFPYGTHRQQRQPRGNRTMIGSSRVAVGPPCSGTAPAFFALQSGAVAPRGLVKPRVSRPSHTDREAGARTQGIGSAQASKFPSLENHHRSSAGVDGPTCSGQDDNDDHDRHRRRPAAAAAHTQYLWPIGCFTPLSSLQDTLRASMSRR